MWYGATEAMIEPAIVAFLLNSREPIPTPKTDERSKIPQAEVIRGPTSYVFDPLPAGSHPDMHACIHQAVISPQIDHVISRYLRVCTPPSGLVCLKLERGAGLSAAAIKKGWLMRGMV